VCTGATLAPAHAAVVTSGAAGLSAHPDVPVLGETGGKPALNDAVGADQVTAVAHHPALPAPPRTSAAALRRRGPAQCRRSAAVHDHLGCAG